LKCELLNRACQEKLLLMDYKLTVKYRQRMPASRVAAFCRRRASRCYKLLIFCGIIHD
jgi:hypothetical protein